MSLISLKSLCVFPLNPSFRASSAPEQRQCSHWKDTRRPCCGCLMTWLHITYFSEFCERFKACVLCVMREMLALLFRFYTLPASISVDLSVFSSVSLSQVNVLSNLKSRCCCSPNQMNHEFQSWFLTNRLFFPNASRRKCEKKQSSLDMMGGMSSGASSGASSGSRSGSRSGLRVKVNCE